MSLKETDFKSEYRSNSENDPKTFYKKCYVSSCKFRRASGYFSSSIYDLFKPEILAFVNKGGSLELICSQVLNSEDIKSITSGYKQKSELMENTFSKEIEQILENKNTSDEVDFVATLIKFDKLKIKIVFYRDGSGIFHEKTGYFVDQNKNIISFSGSANESFSGMSGFGNFERIKVFRSWNESETIQVKNDKRLIDSIWENNEEGLNTIDFPKVPKSLFLERAKAELDEIYFPKLKSLNIKKKKIDNLEDYQQEAIRNWENQNYRGILKHATGSGKTITSLHALDKHMSRGLPTIVLVPSQLLLSQWFIEINNEINEPVILRCGAGHTEWKRTNFFQNILKRVSGKKGGILLAVMDTVSKPEFQKLLYNFDEILIIVDEVHAVGSANHLSILDYNFGKRLGLSATPERYNDPEGTEKIIKFFGGIVKPIITIQHAINKGRLVKYDYFPTIVYLNAEEEEEWIKYTEKIIQHVTFKSDKNRDKIFKDDQYLQNLLIQRSKIAKKADRKVSLVLEIINKNFRDGEFWLVYCEDQDQLNTVDIELKKIGYKPYIYTSSLQEKTDELNLYKQSGGILLSIRCLDEGIDIPQISHAVIAASSQNPRQFIQRRGRVLRTFKGKVKATIFDFFTAPVNPQTKFNGLIKNEFKRGIEFAKTALNAREADSTLRQILIKMNVDPNEIIDDLETSENE